ncbi:hypothetical protein QM312_37220, partial [Burkholderia cenocepacia]|nr:hypothetical protein [Burkholderia cenocepacia]
QDQVAAGEVGGQRDRGRDLILFSTFLLIIATLVVQGGTLAPLIRVLKLRPAARHTMSEHAVRAHTFGAALAE